MAGGKRVGAGERVLEGRHVIGLFFLMLLFSGVFFTLGYVMGRNQFEGQVRAESTHDMNAPVIPRDTGKRNTGPVNPDPAPPSDLPIASPSSDWEFYHAGEKKAADDHLKPAAPTAKTISTAVKPDSPARSAQQALRPANNTTPRGTYLLQVAALTREADAMALASTLQKKRFPAYVMSPQGDKFYRVQVGPYSDQKSADAARKGLESAGFKAIVKH